MLNMHGNDVGTDGVEAECLRTLSAKMKCILFGFHLKKLLLMVNIWAMVNAATGAAITPQPYQCYTFESLDSKISKFSIKWGMEDICIHNPYANLFTCTKGSFYFIINGYNVKFCNKTNTVEALIMEHGQSRTAIQPSSHEELSDEEFAVLSEHFGCNPPTTTANPFPTTQPETRDHLPMIIAAVVVVILAMVLYVSVCYCRHVTNILFFFTLLCVLFVKLEF